MSDNIIYLDLTYDELAFLQVRLITPPLLGMGTILPENISEEAGMIRLQSGASSLYARGFLHDSEDGKLQIESLAVSVIATYAQARLAIQVLNVPGPGVQPRRFTYYISEKLALEHIYDEARLVHHFTLTTEPDIIADLIADRMEMHTTQAPDVPEVTLDGPVLKAVNDAVRANQPKKAVQALQAAGVHQAETMVNIINSGEPQNTVIFFQSGEAGLDTSGTFVLYQDRDSSLLAVPEGERVRIEPMANEAVFQRIRDRLVPILA